MPKPNNMPPSRATATPDVDAFAAQTEGATCNYLLNMRHDTLESRAREYLDTTYRNPKKNPAIEQAVVECFKGHGLSNPFANDPRANGQSTPAAAH